MLIFKAFTELIKIYEFKLNDLQFFKYSTKNEHYLYVRINKSNTMDGIRKNNIWIE